MNDNTYLHLRESACSSDACEQGRKSCPCPSACQVPWATECEREMNDWFWVSVRIGLIMLAVFGVAMAIEALL